MMQILDKLWVSDSDGIHKVESGGLLNVAHDLKGIKFWPKVEYAQIGLINGPGNEVSDYCSAILFLKGMLRRHDKVIVYDHNGSIGFAVVVMYLNLIEGQHRPEHNSWSRWLTWEEKTEIIYKRLEIGRVAVHEAHIEAFNKIKWSLLEVL